MTVQAFRVHADDNVATLLSDADEGALVAVLGEAWPVAVTTKQAIRGGHKVALCAFAEGDRILKYGFPIGVASKAIAKGDWVHLQNCSSLYDSLSSALDVESGARNETRYV
jgi:hypothetical protein